MIVLIELNTGMVFFFLSDNGKGHFWTFEVRKMGKVGLRIFFENFEIFLFDFYTDFSMI